MHNVQEHGYPVGFSVSPGECRDTNLTKILVANSPTAIPAPSIGHPSHVTALAPETACSDHK